MARESREQNKRLFEDDDAATLYTTRLLSPVYMSNERDAPLKSSTDKSLLHRSLHEDRRAKTRPSGVGK